MLFPQTLCTNTENEYGVPLNKYYKNRVTSEKSEQWTLPTFFDLQQFCRPLSWKDAQYLVWEHFTTLNGRMPAKSIAALLRYLILAQNNPNYTYSTYLHSRGTIDNVGYLSLKLTRSNEKHRTISSHSRDLSFLTWIEVNCCLFNSCVWYLSILL